MLYVVELLTDADTPPAYIQLDEKEDPAAMIGWWHKLKLVEHVWEATPMERHMATAFFDQWHGRYEGRMLRLIPV